MSKPVESFFDEVNADFRFWEKPTSNTVLSPADIIFQGPLLKLHKGSNAFRERFFVLTRDTLYYLKSENESTVVAQMKTQWVRSDFLPIELEQFKGEKLTCIRFVRNLRFTDLYCADENVAAEWREHFSRVFIQSDFHTKFSTIKSIGKGSFARVYLVEKKKGGQKFAVKAFSKEYLLSQAKGRDSVMNEISVMQRLSNKYVMHLEEVHESKNSIYLVLELLEGGELLSYISQKDHVTSKEVHRIMKCIMEALAYMASRNVMHRDLKPDNMILKEKNKLENCTLKLVDFGLATQCDLPEYLFKRCGTPGFVAPEVINAPSNENIHYDPKCDIFSAGVIFFILLTERSPFDGKSFKEILQKNKQCKIDFKNPKLRKNPAALDLLQKMLENEPEKRISAKDALAHRFFTDIEDMNMVIEHEHGFESNLKEYNEQYKNIMEKGRFDETNSLVIREGMITGKTNTVCDSANSQGIIPSFKSMSSPKKAEASSKRESILKLVLLQNAHSSQSGDIYDSTKFAAENFESDTE